MRYQIPANAYRHIRSKKRVCVSLLWPAILSKEANCAQATFRNRSREKQTYSWGLKPINLAAIWHHDFVSRLIIQILFFFCILIACSEKRGIYPANPFVHFTCDSSSASFSRKSVRRCLYCMCTQETKMKREGERNRERESIRSCIHLVTKAISGRNVQHEISYVVVPKPCCCIVYSLSLPLSINYSTTLTFENTLL